MAKRRLLYLEPTSTSLMAGHFQRLLDGAAGPGTRVEVRHLPLPGAPLIPSFSRAGYALVGELLGRVKRAEEDGYDAVIIGCSSDPGLYLAKRLSRIPVVGPLEAGLHTASILTQRTVVITAGTWAEVRWLEDRARLYGLHHQITSIRRIRVDRPTDAELGGWMLHQPEKARQALLRSYERAVSVPGVAASQIQAAIEEEGIESVYFACTFFSGMLDPLRQEFRIPMLDPALGALRVAEMLVKAGRGILYGGHENA